jgi:cytochrome c oxidase assembly protein subunit 15
MRVSANPASGLIEDRHAPVRRWLWATAGMIALTAVVGAATRLTGSGLSITEWNPIMGVIPPLNEAEWQAALAKYREIPQYKLINRGMSLEAFKVIFWWEWAHRMLARAIGVVFLVPFLALLAARRIPRSLVPMLLVVFALGALQGAVGWYMVRSGLVDRVDVSQYRLALHLGLAVLIFGLLVRAALQLAPHQGDVERAGVTVATWLSAVGLVGLIYLQILLGALVAGLKAGRTYTTWPLMDGRFVPEGLLQLQPAWVNLFENAALVQFNHRIAAYIVTGLAAAHAVRIWRSVADQRIRRTAAALAVLTLAQAALGVWTLLAWVPVGLGVAHQFGALVVLAVAIAHASALERMPVPRRAA